LIIAAALAATLVGMASPASAAVTVANWQMNALPTLVDSAGGDNNGTTRNITLSSGFYRFNGTSSYATVPDKANLDPGSAVIKLTARVNIGTSIPVSATNTFDIVRKGISTTSGGYYKMEIARSASNTAIAVCRFKDSSGRAGEAYGTVNLAGKGWVVITCRKTSTGVTVSAAGQTITAPKTLGSIANTSPVFIGQKGDGTDWFKGLMDYVKIDVG
jgi:hypothetical protein